MPTEPTDSTDPPSHDHVPDHPEDARAVLARRALGLYVGPPPLTLRDVSLKLGVSYGKAHALIVEAGSHAALRPRGTRLAAPPVPDPPAPAEPEELTP